MVVLLGWVPLLVLAVVQGLAWRGGTEGSFLVDFAVHARSLVAAPLFIIAESFCIPRLGAIARHFLEAELVAGPDRARFDDAVTSSRRLLDSPSAELMAVIAAFGLVAALMLSSPHEEFLAWQRPVNGHTLSLAGWWHVVVSLPWLLVLFFGWLWRILIWGRFLWLMSRLDLQLIAAHPDLAGGLKFVGTSIRVYAPPRSRVGNGGGRWGRQSRRAPGVYAARVRVPCRRSGYLGAFPVRRTTCGVQPQSAPFEATRRV